MRTFDVFNGDADGLCALNQLRLAAPCESTLVTGVKRDIRLLARVTAGPGDRVTVLDVSLDSNREGLLAVLEAGAHVTYFDHHFPGDIPRHPNLEATIDTAPETCTSVLVDQALDGRFRPWAVVGAFGDNFDETARRLAAPLGYGDETLAALRELGVLINYNAYGSTVEDLHFTPETLHRRMREFADPLAFIAEDTTVETLRAGHADDMARAGTLVPERETDARAVYLLPAEAWARRVSGVFVNGLARGAPGRAHALLTDTGDGHYVVSVRAPLDRREGADELCRRFPTGGGRRAAAGINRLSATDLERFLRHFAEAYP